MLIILYKFWLRGHGLADTNTLYTSPFDILAQHRMQTLPTGQKALTTAFNGIRIGFEFSLIN
ncbi:hypothetical protein AD948_10810 [Acetobacter senegalensis]|uniref:Uncharacterized protein n=1 Tax=Acetobacter senegalensis TaxID=446692 RepID=A0A149U0B1_9PROT|nr:hypothetical protein AD948_10810 [Acetobacter senegalensis]